MLSCKLFYMDEHFDFLILCPLMVVFVALFLSLHHVSFYTFLIVP